MAISEKIYSRINDGIKKFKPIIDAKKKQDINESDTVNLIRDILSEVFGFDKYEDITSEHLIRGTYCDLALKINGKVKMLIEAKAIDIELKESHVKQVIDYAVNDAIDWVILSNAVMWKLFKVVYSKPIDHELISEINFLELNNRHREDLEKLAILTKEGITKCSLDEFYSQKQANSKYMVSTLICSDNVIHVIRKELRQIYPEVKVEAEEIRKVLMNDVIKRELMEGDNYEEARKKISRFIKKRDKNLEKDDVAPSNAESMPSSQPPLDIQPS